MGRHSRPEDLDSEDDGTAAVDESASAGRHASGSDHRRPTPSPGPLPDPASAGAAAGAPSTIGDDAQNASRNLMQGTAADWKLIRDHADVRNRCLAALLAPYLVYTVAMLLIGQMDAYLIWVFLPTVTAGLLIGATLDHAHKRHQDE